jgi:N-acetylmuramoyl-L-alanine amidase
MKPLFTPCIEVGSATDIGQMIVVPDSGGPRFRGSWAHAYHSDNGAVDYRRSFTPSEAYGEHAFALGTPTAGATPGTATTTVDPDGYTAIRVNLPPIGFNKARVSIQIDGFTPINLLDLEVPTVVVIDPGHGGAIGDAEDNSDTHNDGKCGGSSWNKGTSATGVREKAMTLRVSEQLRKCIRNKYWNDNLLGHVYFTKEGDRNMGISARANVARDKGADIFLSIHFNGGPSSVRGSEVWVHPQDKPAGQFNFSNDETFATRLVQAISGRIGTSNRGVKQYRDVRWTPNPGHGVAKISYGFEVPREGWRFMVRLSS